MSRVPRRCWDGANMKAAIMAVRSKKIGYLKAQTTYQVPRGSLFRLVKLLKDNPRLSVDDVISIPLGRKPVFDPVLESQLANHCLEMEKRYFGLSAGDVRRLAYQLATANNIACPFNKDDKSAGRKWFKQFLVRNPHLSLRTPQGTSLNRVRGFNRENVEKFFEILENEYDKHSYPAHRVFNCDETGLTVVQSKHVKVVSKKGKKQIGALTSAERGSLVTVVTCMSAGGTFIPPLMIFPRTNMKNELMDGAPPGSIFDCHKSGWIQMDMFTKWFRHFVSITKPSAEDPVLLLLDGHYSHSRNLDVIEYAREHHVVIVCLPPHSSHKLQPLDLSFMHPLKTFYNNEIRKWLANHNNPVRPVTQYQVSELFGRAYARAATLETAMNGFRLSGTYPLDKEKFRDYDFPNEETHTVPQETNSANGVVNSACDVSVNDLCPIPPLNVAATSNRGPKRGSAMVLTSTPKKNELQVRRESVKRNLASTLSSNICGNKRINRETRKRKPSVVESEDSSEIDGDLETSASEDDTRSEQDTSEEDDAQCIYCSELWSQSRTEWIQCQKCRKWAHINCAGNPKKRFLCCNCK